MLILNIKPMQITEFGKGGEGMKKLIFLAVICIGFILSINIPRAEAKHC
jgi:hypothetical protein